MFGRHLSDKLALKKCMDKYLGVLMDSKLSFKSHGKGFKLNFALSHIRHIRHQMSTQAAKM